jgi:hypothetical protein
MLDMVMEEKNKEYFITDIDVKDGKIIITRADGSVSEENFTAHNLGFYRMRMIDSAKEYINPFMDDLGKDSFMTFVKRYAAIIAGVVGLFFLYNVDVHIIMKIIISILVVLGELGYYLYNELYLNIIGGEVLECLATEYYIKNLNSFRYYDKENYTDGYIVPPEDIGKYQLTKDVLEQLKNGIEEFKNKGFESEEITLSYKRQTDVKKSML